MKPHQRKTLRRHKFYNRAIKRFQASHDGTKADDAFIRILKDLRDEEGRSPAPTTEEITQSERLEQDIRIADAVLFESFDSICSDILESEEAWDKIPVGGGKHYDWKDKMTLKLGELNIRKGDEITVNTLTGVIAIKT